MTMRKMLILAAACLPLAACSTAMEAVKGPELAPVGYPAHLAPIEQAYVQPQATPAAQSLVERFSPF